MVKSQVQHRQPTHVAGASCVNGFSSLVPRPCSRLDNSYVAMAHLDGFSGFVSGSSRGLEGGSWETMVGVTDLEHVTV